LRTTTIYPDLFDVEKLRSRKAPGLATTSHDNHYRLCLVHLAIFDGEHSKLLCNILANRIFKRSKEMKTQQYCFPHNNNRMAHI
jgi:hypothetical protein